MALCCAGAALWLAQAGGRAAAAPTDGAGFHAAAAANPAEQVHSGGRVQYSFEFTNGDSTSVSRLIAYDYVPFGTTLVANSESCAGGGEACTPTSRGDILEWVVPAGARPGASFIMSFTVAVATRYPPAAIENQLTFTGPGCSSTTGCTERVAPVAVTPLPSAPSTIRMAPISVGEFAQIAAATTVPTDNQNLQVRVPKCTNVKKKPKCHEPPGRSSGSGAQGGAGGGGAQHSTGQGPGRLVATGDDEVNGIELGSLSLLTGACLVVAAAAGRRGRGSRRAVASRRAGADAGGADRA